jgi:hypothetical protein
MARRARGGPLQAAESKGQQDKYFKLKKIFSGVTKFYIIDSNKRKIFT